MTIKVQTITKGILPAKVVGETLAHFIVKLPDGNIVKRHKRKHIVR